MIYIKVAHKPPLCMNIPTRRLWGPIRSPLDSVGVFLSVLGGGGVGGGCCNRPSGADFLILEEANLPLRPGCIHQEYSSREERAGSGPRAATRLERVVEMQTRLLEMQTRLLARAALVALAVAVLCAAASTTIPAEWDAGPDGGKKKQKLFWHLFFFPRGNAGRVLWTRYGCKIATGVFPFPIRGLKVSS